MASLIKLEKVGRAMLQQITTTEFYKICMEKKLEAINMQVVPQGLSKHRTQVVEWKAVQELTDPINITRESRVDNRMNIFNNHFNKLIIWQFN